MPAVGSGAAPPAPGWTAGQELQKAGCSALRDEPEKMTADALNVSERDMAERMCAFWVAQQPQPKINAHSDEGRVDALFAACPCRDEPEAHGCTEEWGSEENSNGAMAMVVMLSFAVLGICVLYYCVRRRALARAYRRDDDAAGEEENDGSAGRVVVTVEQPGGSGELCLAVLVTTARHEDGVCEEPTSLPGSPPGRGA